MLSREKLIDLLARKGTILHIDAHFDIENEKVEDAAERIGADTKIWRNCHIREGAQIGDRCTLGENVHVDVNVKIGNGCKIQNNVSLFRGVKLEDDVFVGPAATFTNVLTPRAFIKRPLSEYKNTIVRKGASIGANATIVCGVKIGQYAMVGAGAVVTKEVPEHALVVGCPARVVGSVCRCGARLDRERDCGSLEFPCTVCTDVYHYDPDRKRFKLMSTE